MTATLALVCEAPALQADAPVAAPVSSTSTVTADEAGRRARLLDWLSANGARFDRLAIDQCADERGVRATADIAEGDEVARVPQRLFITTEMIRQTPLGARLAAHSPELTERACLAAYLLEARRDGGFWQPYVDALPREFPGHPLFFGAAELMALNPMTAFGPIVKSVRELAGRDYASIAPLLAEAGFDRADFDWAYCCVRTRAYNLAKGEQPPRLAMIPLADMLNHVNRPATGGSRPDQDDYVITATRAVAAGAEVTATYGEMANATLHAVYGFQLADNEFDVAMLMFGNESHLVSRKYAEPRVREVFRTLRRSTPLLLRDAVSTDGAEPCAIEHEFSCLDTLHRACEAALPRLAHAMVQGDPARAAMDPRGSLAAVLAAQESESNVLCHWLAVAQTAGRVLRDRGTRAEDRALLAYFDADYAAQIIQLIDKQGGTT